MSDDSIPTPRLARIASVDGVVLEAEAHLPAAPRAAVVITHPHPTYGGSMHATIPALLYRQARLDAIAAVRFNFRGVGASTGTHDHGGAERHDVAAVVAALRHAVGPGVPLGLAGWSFGADVALSVPAAAVDAHDLRGWMAVAPPLALVPLGEMSAASSPLPKLLVVPEFDQGCPPSCVAERTATWPNTERVTVPGNDHFLASGSAEVVAAFTRFVALLDS